MDDDNNSNKPNLKVLDFEKERAKLRDESEEAEPENEVNIYTYLLELYARNVAAFQYIESETNYELAMQKIREAFNHALSVVDLDHVEESIVGYEVEFEPLEELELDEEEEYPELDPETEAMIENMTEEEFNEYIDKLEQGIEDEDDETEE